MEAPSFDAPVADWLVYGDSLQQQGDPRGALIAISHAIAAGTAGEEVRDAYLKEHGAALFGVAAAFIDSYRFDWRCGIPLGVEVRISAASGDRELALLDGLIAKELREITLVGVTNDRSRVDLAPAMSVLASRRPPHLTKFAFVDERAQNASELISRDYAPGKTLVGFGSLRPFYPFAEEIRVVAADSHQVELSPLAAPALIAFSLESLRFADMEDANAMLRRFERIDVPNLERFRLRLTETWFANIAAEQNPYTPVYSEYYAERALEDEDEDEEDDDDEEDDEDAEAEGADEIGPTRYDEEAEVGDTNGVNWRALGDLLGALERAPLKELALTGFESAQTLIESLERVGLAPTLEVLDLSDSAFDDGLCRWIARHPTKFARLKRIVIERTNVTPAGIATLQSLGPEIVHGGERRTYRYIVGSE